MTDWLKVWQQLQGHERECLLTFLLCIQNVRPVCSLANNVKLLAILCGVKVENFQHLQHTFTAINNALHVCKHEQQTRSITTQIYASFSNQTEDRSALNLQYHKYKVILPPPQAPAFFVFSNPHLLLFSAQLDGLLHWKIHLVQRTSGIYQTEGGPNNPRTQFQR